jgi:hypothetical protein
VASGKDRSERIREQLVVTNNRFLDFGLQFVELWPEIAPDRALIEMMVRHS